MIKIAIMKAKLFFLFFFISRYLVLSACGFCHNIQFNGYKWRVNETNPIPYNSTVWKDLSASLPEDRISYLGNCCGDYTGYWEIINNKLFLRDIQVEMRGESDSYDLSLDGLDEQSTHQGYGYLWELCCLVPTGPLDTP